MFVERLLNLQVVLLVPEYIKYRRKAKKRHGIHSPFVYDLSDRCLSIEQSKEEKAIMSNLIAKLNNDSREITINDFGAGSKNMSNQRSVKSILKNSSSKGKYGHLLYQLARHYQPTTILELGTSVGVGTHFLSLGNPSANIHTVEGCENTRAIALENLPKNVNSILGTFNDYLDELPESILFDLIYIDGHHDGTALTQYVNRLKKHASNSTIWVLDDIRWSNSMKEAWDTIIQDSFFHVSIDFFRFGILVQRTEQKKEHFTLLP